MKKYINKKQTIVFKDLTKEELVDHFDKTLPVKLLYNEDLVNRVSLRYPDLPKKEVTLVVKSFFQVIRAKLLLGEVINLQGIFSMLKTYYFTFHRFNKTFPGVKLKVKTPTEVKNAI